MVRPGTPVAWDRVKTIQAEAWGKIVGAEGARGKIESGGA